MTSAGHADRQVHPVSKVPFTRDGNLSGNARADAGSWRGVLEFPRNYPGTSVER
jgi:hypothetical protein